MKLIRVFDNYYNFLNVIVPLSMDFDELIYIYHHKITNEQITNCSEVIHKYKKNIKIQYKYIKDDEKEITSLLDKETIIDISTARYLSAYLFEKALNNNLGIVYYDDEKSQIKDYRKHEVIVDKVFSLTIDDVIKLGGGIIQYSPMHNSVDLKDKDTQETIINIVENNINNYSMFINFIQRINTFITHRKINNLTYRISDEIKNKIIHDEMYIKNQKYNLFKIEDNRLIFKNSYIRDLFSVAGTFLENYLYIKLSNSNKFDQVLMSSVIDFSNYYNRYKVVCEIDLLAIRNNHLLFISCKSNKVNTDALNEIKIHNTIFGNNLSFPVICTIDDLSKTSPLEYLKAKELNIPVIDKTSFIKDNIVEDIVSITNNKYQYERV